MAANIAKRASAAGVAHDLLSIPGPNSPPLVLGIGSGSTIVPFVEYLKNKMLKTGSWSEVKPRVVCVPTSWQAKDLITQADLQLGDLSQFPVIDLDVDGADEVDPSLNLIKGGGACHLQEKMVAFNSKNFVVVADDSKDSPKLGTKWTQGVPIEVIPAAYVPIQKYLIDKLGAKTATLRMAQRKAGPVVTDNGNLVLDAHFGPIDNPTKLENDIKMISGVVEVGLFVGMASRVYFGQADGSCIVKDKTSTRTIPANELQ